jgi:hypothetical protein
MLITTTPILGVTKFRGSAPSSPTITGNGSWAVLQVAVGCSASAWTRSPTQQQPCGVKPTATVCIALSFAAGEEARPLVKPLQLGRALKAARHDS